MSKKNDPDLAPDAVLATDLGDPEERYAKQVAEMGGDIDEIDSYDPTDEDDGSVLPEDHDPDNPAPAKSPSDEDTEDGDTDDKDTDDDSEDDSSDADGDDADDDDSDGDSDDSEDEDADADDDSEDEGDADKKPAQKGIPKRRFDEVNEEKKSLREENTRLKAQIEAGKPPEDQEEPFDVRAGEKEYMDMLLDGDTDGALAKREEIDAAKEARWKSETQASTKTEIETDAESSELLSLSHEAEGMFDVFNPDHEDYNQGMLNKVLTFMRGYEASGEMSRGDAFVAGLADVVEMYDLLPEEDTQSGDEDTQSGDEDTSDEKPKPTGKKKKVDPAKKKKLADEAHTPVGGEGTGSADTGAVVPSINDMTDEELDALPEKTLARMRGDLI